MVERNTEEDICPEDIYPEDIYPAFSFVFLSSSRGLAWLWIHGIPFLVPRVLKPELDLCLSLSPALVPLFTVSLTLSLSPPFARFGPFVCVRVSLVFPYSTEF